MVMVMSPVELKIGVGRKTTNNQTKKTQTNKQTNKQTKNQTNK